MARKKQTVDIDAILKVHTMTVAHFVPRSALGMVLEGMEMQVHTLLEMLKRINERNECTQHTKACVQNQIRSILQTSMDLGDGIVYIPPPRMKVYTYAFGVGNGPRMM